MVDQNELKKRLEPVTNKFGLDLVFLFGSQTANQTHAKSDIDLAVQGERPLDMAELTYEIIRALGHDDVDVSDLRTAGPTLGFVVACEGKLLFEKTPGSYLDFCSLAARKYYDAKKFRDARRELLEEFSRQGSP